MSNTAYPTDLSLTIECKQGAVRAVRFNVDGNYCITCGSDKTLKLWNPYKKLLLKTYTGHGYEVLDAKGSSDSSQIASGGMDKIVILWDVTSGNGIRRFRGHVAQVNCVCFNEDSSVILSGSVDGSVQIWDCKSKSYEPIQILKDAKDNVTSLHVSDHEILTGSLDGRVRRYDLRMGELLTDTMGMPVSCVNFTNDGQCLLVSCLDSTIKLIDKDTGQMLAEFTGHKNSDYRIDSCLSSTDAHVLSGSEDGKVYCWDLIESKIKTELKHPTTRAVHSLSYHPNSPHLLTAVEGNIYLWKNDET